MKRDESALLYQRWMLRMREREARLRLFQPLHQLPDVEVCVRQGTWYRASGAQFCPYCKLEYREHPFVEEWGNSDDKRLCSGDVVHL